MTLNNFDQPYTDQPQATPIDETPSEMEHPLSEQATFSAGEQTYVAPRTPLEEALASTWAQVLEIERVGICDDFFDLGGDSLLATDIISRLRSTLQVELSLSNFFEAPTVAQHAEILEQRKASNSKSSAPGLGIRTRDSYRVSSPSNGNDSQALKRNG